MLTQIFEPVREAFFATSYTMPFLLPIHGLPENATVAVLIGLSGQMDGVWKIVHVLRHLRCVHVYECVSHGREWWFTLHLTTDTRYSLVEMHPDARDRSVLYYSFHTSPSDCDMLLVPVL